MHLQILFHIVCRPAAHLVLTLLPAALARPPMHPTCSEHNATADALANLAMDAHATVRSFILEAEDLACTAAGMQSGVLDLGVELVELQHSAPGDARRRLSLWQHAVAAAGGNSDAAVGAALRLVLRVLECGRWPGPADGPGGASGSVGAGLDSAAAGAMTGSAAATGAEDAQWVSEALPSTAGFIRELLQRMQSNGGEEGDEGSGASGAQRSGSGSAALLPPQAQRELIRRTLCCLLRWRLAQGVGVWAFEADTGEGRQQSDLGCMGSNGLPWLVCSGCLTSNGTTTPLLCV